MMDRGQLQVTDIATMPASDPLTDPVDELIELAAMTQDAPDAGYTGLRMMANGTMRVVDPRRRDRFVRYEHLLDRFCLDHAFTGLCALNAAAIGEDLVAELGCVHALTHGELSPFRLRAAREADAALAGSVDASWVAYREVDSGRPAGVSTGGFPRAASRTRRARFRATGAPQAPSWVVWAPHPVTGHGGGITVPRYRYRVVRTFAGLNSCLSFVLGHHPPAQ